MNLRKRVKDTCCWKFINTKPGKYVKFFILLVLDMINLAVDWYFYAKIQLVEPGLVYGPPNNAIRWATLSFCIISIVSFIIEVIQNADDLLINRKLPFLSQSMSNFLVIFFEDIPLMVLNLIVTLCRDGEPTVISVVKASVAIGAVIIRLILMIVIYWLLTEGKKSRFILTTDILSTIGLMIIAGISISIQLLNNFPTNSNGLIQTTDPSKFNQMEYAREKYLNNVGIYSKWPLDDSSKENNRYLWLADINEIIDNSYVLIQIRTDLNLNYSTTSNNYTICIKKKLTDCYSILNNTYSVKIDSNKVDLNSFKYNGFDVGFTKEPAQEYKYKLGYIDYNANILTNSSCKQTSGNSLIYAKFPAGGSSQSNYMRNSSLANTFTFFNYDIDLLRVDRIWLTGILKCPMVGDLGPKISTEIRLSC